MMNFLSLINPAKIAQDANNRFTNDADKTKLAGIATGANNYSHPTGDGNLHVPANGTTNLSKFLQAGPIAGVIAWGVALINLSEDTTPQLGGSLDCNGNSIGGTETDNGNSGGAAKIIDWSKGNHQKVIMTGNCTFIFTAPAKPCALSLRFINDATTGRTITLPIIKWPGGIAPTWTKLANAIDILNLYYDGASYYGMVSLAWA